MLKTQDAPDTIAAAAGGINDAVTKKASVESQATKSPRKLDVINISGEVTPEDAQWAADNLADLDIRYLPHDSDTETMDNGDGTEWRDGFDLDVVTLKTGERVFRVLVPRGADVNDLEYADRVIHNARGGAFLNHGWHQAKDQNGAPRYRFAMWVRRPIVHGSFEAVACTEPLCGEYQSWHGQNNNHEAAYFGQNTPACHYEIIVERAVDSESEPWQICVNASDVYVTPEQAAVFVSDLQKAQEACERANAALAAVTS